MLKERDLLKKRLDTLSKGGKIAAIENQISSNDIDCERLRQNISGYEKLRKV